jgi:type II secretory pathway pseudopilin PulG
MNTRTFRQIWLKTPANRRACGFSLLEVLIAFTLLAVAIAVLMRLFSGGVNNADLADRYARAAMLAESRLAQVGAEEKLTEGDFSGEFDEDYAWTMAVRLYATTTEPPAPSTLERAALANAEARGTPLPAALTPANPNATTTLGNVDIDANMFIRLYEIELTVVFKSDDGRSRQVTLNALKIGPRP